MGGCPGKATIWSVLRFHFVHRHVWKMLVVLDERSHPLPLCPKCDTFVTCRELNRYHQATDMCARGAKRKLKQLQEEEMRLSMAVAFQTYGRPL